jgi:hypothetical protein
MVELEKMRLDSGKLMDVEQMVTLTGCAYVDEKGRLIPHDVVMKIKKDES